MHDRLPTELYEKIQRHLVEQSSRGEEGWDAGADEEDTLTGDFCGSLRKSWSRRAVYENGRWRWRVRYKKFRGRGRGAEERLLGADGIVQIEIEHTKERVIENKGLLFQAKKYTARFGAKLLDQCRQMEQVSPNGSAVFVYGPNQYTAIDSKSVISTEGKTLHPDDSDRMSIGHFLAHRFLSCEVGVKGMFYDAVKGTLIVPNETTGVVQIRKQLKHRLSIEVQSVD